MFEQKTFLLCLEQRLVLLEKCLTLTKEIAVRADDPEEIDLDRILPERQGLMDRIDKCGALMDRMLSELSLEEKTVWNEILKGKPVPADWPDAAFIQDIVSRCRRTLEEMIAWDQTSTSRLSERYQSLQEKLNELRERRKQPGIFSSSG